MWHLKWFVPTAIGIVGTGLIIANVYLPAAVATVMWLLVLVALISSTISSFSVYWVPSRLPFDFTHLGIKFDLRLKRELPLYHGEMAARGIDALNDWEKLVGGAFKIFEELVRAEELPDSVLEAMAQERRKREDAESRLASKEALHKEHIEAVEELARQKTAAIEKHAAEMIDREKNAAKKPESIDAEGRRHATCDLCGKYNVVQKRILIRDDEGNIAAKKRTVDVCRSCRKTHPAARDALHPESKEYKGKRAQQHSVTAQQAVAATSAADQ
jgi:hypothetical protein